MKRRFFLLAMAGALAAGCKGGLSMSGIPGIGGEKVSDEEQIAAVLDDVHRGLEKKQVYRVLAHVSRSYRDEEGRDYEALRDYLAGLMRGYRVIRITRTPPRILVQQNRARAIETLGTMAEPYDPNKNLPVNIQGQVAVHLERIGDTWQIVKWSTLR